MGPGKVTLAELLSTVRQRADLENTDFVTDPELTGWLNSSAGELWDALVGAYEGYAEASATYVTSGSNVMAMPIDFLKSDGLDLEISPSPAGLRTTLKRISWSDRNKYQWPTWSFWPTHYALKGESIYLFPTPPSGKTITLWYVPRTTPLAASGTIQILAAISAGHSITINGRTFVFGPGEGEIAIGGTAAITASNFDFAIYQAATSPTSALYGITTSILTDTVTLICARPLKVALTAISPTFYCPKELWASYLDGFDGWEELVILDAVIKAKLKDEQDVSAELALKETKRQRITEAAANRDSGAPVPIADTWDPTGIGTGQYPFGGTSGRWGW